MTIHNEISVEAYDATLVSVSTLRGGVHKLGKQF